jgi:hypothetical protein
VARVLDLAVELAVGEGAGAAFAELHVASGLSSRLRHRPQVSLVRSRTALPRSSTMGLKPICASTSAAKMPQGPGIDQQDGLALSRVVAALEDTVVQQCFGRDAEAGADCRRKRIRRMIERQGQTGKTDHGRGFTPAGVRRSSAAQARPLGLPNLRFPAGTRPASSPCLGPGLPFGPECGRGLLWLASRRLCRASSRG